MLNALIHEFRALCLKHPNKTFLVEQGQNKVKSADRRFLSPKLKAQFDVLFLLAARDYEITSY